MTAHAQHHIHHNSRLAHIAVRQTLPARQSEILRAVKRLGSATDRGIAAWLSYPDLNQVRPRVTELVKAGLLVEIRSQRCPVTGKRVRVVALPFELEAA